MITGSTSILDVVAEYPVSEDFFRQYDELAGRCVLCSNLFDSLEQFCGMYDIDLNKFLSSLNIHIEKSPR